MFSLPLAGLIAACGQSASPTDRGAPAGTGMGTNTAAADPTLWYRVRIATSYRGQAVAFDQFVACASRTIPGAALGTIPSVTSRKMHPMSVGRTMTDGSFLAVRLPDLCRYNRRYDPGTPSSDTRLPGWRRPGPFTFFPLMVWSDRRVRPDRTEVIVAEGYYRSDRARFDRPVATVEFMAAGFQPVDAASVSEQPNVIDDDVVNRKENGDLPTDVAMTAPIALPMSEPLAVGSVPLHLAPAARNADNPGRFSIYAEESAPFVDEGFRAEPPHLSWTAVRECLDALQAGRPYGPAFAATPEDDATLGGHDAADVAARRNVRASACHVLLDGLIPFEEVGGRLVAAQSRGLLIFGRPSATSISRPMIIDGIEIPRLSVLKDGEGGRWFKMIEQSSPVRDPDLGE